MIACIRVFFAATLLCITVSAAATARLELASPPLIVIASDTPTATGVIYVRNSGDTPAQASFRGQVGDRRRLADGELAPRNLARHEIVDGLVLRQRAGE